MIHLPALCAAQRQLDQRHVAEPPSDKVVQIERVPPVAKSAHGIDAVNTGVIAGGGEVAQSSLRMGCRRRLAPAAGPGGFGSGPGERSSDARPPPRHHAVPCLTWGRFRIRVKAGHKARFPKSSAVREGLPFRTSEAIFYHLENSRVFGVRWRDHFWTLGRITGDMGSVGHSEVIGWSSKALVSIGLSVSNVLMTTFYTYPEPTPACSPPDGAPRKSRDCSRSIARRSAGSAPTSRHASSAVRLVVHVTSENLAENEPTR